MSCSSACYIASQLNLAVEMLALSLRTPSLCMIPFGAIPSLIYTFGPSTTRKSALLTDVLSLSFSYNALCFLTLDSFKTGCILLSGLFLYDVWWVFGTEVVRPPPPARARASHTR